MNGWAKYSGQVRKCWFSFVLYTIYCVQINYNLHSTMSLTLHVFVLLNCVVVRIFFFHIHINYLGPLFIFKKRK